jgi:hypothetical protein
VFLEAGPCSSMDISRSGRYLAAGQSSSSLRVRAGRRRQASTGGLAIRLVHGVRCCCVQ